MSFLRLSAIAFLFLHGTVSCFQMSMESTSKNSFSASLDSSRRGFFATSSKMAPTFLSLVGISTINPSLAIAAGGASKESLLSDLQTSRAKMEKIPSLLQNGEWDAVRTILKTPPLNKLWNLGEVRYIHNMFHTKCVVLINYYVSILTYTFDYSCLFSIVIYSI